MSTEVEIRGVGTVEFPDSMSEDEIRFQLNRLTHQSGPDPLNLKPELIPGVPQSRMSAAGGPRDTSTAEAVTRGLATQFAGNVANFPNLALTAAANVPLVRDMLLPSELTGFQVPKIGDKVLPTPSGEQVVAGLETAAEIPGRALTGSDVDLSAMFGQNLTDARALAREKPTATQIGGLLGDGLTLATGRVPGARVLNRPGKSLVPVPPPLQPGARRALDRFVHSQSANTFMRGVRRAGETGFEAALLAALDDADPLQSAIYAGVGQAAGSTMLTTGNFVKRKPFASLGYAALVTAVSIQTFQSLAPGGADSVIASIESGFDKTIALAAMAAAAGIAGAGRGRGSALAADFPEVVEGGTALLRGSMLSILKDAAKADPSTQDATSKALQHLATDPNRFSESQLTALRQAFSKGNFVEVVDRLSLDDSFAKIIDSIPSIQLSQDELRAAMRADVKTDSVVRAPQVAKPIAKAIGTDRARRLGLEASEVTPRQFVTQVFGDAGAAEALGKRLNKTARANALAVNLDILMLQNFERTGDKRVFDGDGFREAWSELPEAARQLYTEEQRAAIETFARHADGLSFLPPDAAQALMQRGALTKRLLGGKQ